MLKQGTKVTLTDGREGVVSTHRKIPQSHPIAFEYKVDFPNKKFEWIRRYEVKPMATEKEICAHCGIEQASSCFKRGKNDVVLCWDHMACIDRKPIKP